MKNLKKHLFSTAIQKILDFLAINATQQFTEKTISEETGVKKSAVNLALRELVAEKIVAQRKIGRTSLYNVFDGDYVVREIKILQNILQISSLIEKLKADSQKIILFGSSASGKNTAESDIDIFVLTSKIKMVRNIINSSSLRNKIQLIVKTPAEMLLINKQKLLFFQEIERGRVLWENYGQ